MPSMSSAQQTGFNNCIALWFTESDHRWHANDALENDAREEDSFQAALQTHCVGLFVCAFFASFVFHWMFFSGS